MSELPQAIIEGVGVETASAPRTVGICLNVLAGGMFLGGIVAGVVLLATAEVELSEAPLLVAGVIGCFVGGWAGAALLWATAWLLRHQYDTARLQQRILYRLGESVSVMPIPLVQVVSPEGGAADGGDEPDVDGKALAAVSSARMLQQVLAELRQLRADVLLSPKQRQAKQEMFQQEQSDRHARQISGALDAGDLLRADQQLLLFARAFPGDPRCAKLRSRLGEELADEAVRAFEAGKLSQAEQAISRLADACADHPRLEELRERIVDHLADGVERSLKKGNLAAAVERIRVLEERFPDHERCVQLQLKLADSRSAIHDEDVQQVRARVAELMAAAAFDKAEGVAADLVATHPDSSQAVSLLQTVRREAAAFSEERRHRLIDEIRRFADTRQWRHALDAAKRLSENHADSPEAREIASMLPTLAENARLEEVRGLRDQIADFVKRRRFAEAAEIAQDLIRRFPDTQAAVQLREELGRLRARVASGEGHNNT